MFSVTGILSRVSEVVHSSSFNARVSFSIVDVTLSLICSMIWRGISESIFFIDAVSIAIVPNFVNVDGIVSMIWLRLVSLDHVIL